MRLMGRVLLLGILHAEGRWWLIMLIVEGTGFIPRRLANGDNITDCGLVFALHEKLHDFWDLLLRLRRPNTGCLHSTGQRQPFIGIRET
jgi:hypothetical protein